MVRYEPSDSAQTFSGFSELPEEIQTIVLNQYFDKPWTTEFTAESPITASFPKGPVRIDSRQFSRLAREAVLKTRRGTAICDAHALHSLHLRRPRWYFPGVATLQLTKMEPLWHFFEHLKVIRRHFEDLQLVQGGCDLGAELEAASIPWLDVMDNVSRWMVPVPGDSLQDVLQGRKNSDFATWARLAWSRYLLQCRLRPTKLTFKCTSIHKWSSSRWRHKSSTIADAYLKGIMVCVEFEFSQTEALVKQMWLEIEESTEQGSALRRINRTPEELAECLNHFEHGQQLCWSSAKFCERSAEEWKDVIFNTGALSAALNLFYSLRLAYTMEVTIKSQSSE